jgi:hypothetical protein
MSCSEQRMPDIIPRTQSRRALILFNELRKLVGEHQPASEEFGLAKPGRPAVHWQRRATPSQTWTNDECRRACPSLSDQARGAQSPASCHGWVRCFEGPLRVMSVGQRPRDIGPVPPGRPGDNPIYAPSGHKATGMKPNAPFSNRVRVKHWKHPAPASNRDCRL